MRGFSRNTVSKYINILKEKKKIRKKKVGAYSLYFSMEENFLPNSLVLSYYQVILKGLKEYFPDNERGEFFKQLIQKNVDEIRINISPEMKKKLNELGEKPTRELISINLNLFKELYLMYDLFQPDVDISLLEIDADQNKVIYRFKNSRFFEDNEDYIYHLYFMCGVSEGILERALKRKITCRLENNHIAGEKEDSYFDLSIEIGQRTRS